MCRRFAAPLLFAAAVTAVLLQEDAPRAAAQGKDGPNFEQVTTADGVQLTGEFMKTKNGGGNDPVVILMYPPGVDRNMDKGNWKGLAAELNDAGFHVFRFDWRGHGKSTVVKANTFWTNNYTGAYNTKHIRGSQKKPGTIHVKDFQATYFPIYVDDLAAVRTHLDQKNDLGDCNTSSIYLIGAEEAAALGFMWLTVEWSKPAVFTPNAVIAPNGYEVVPDNRFGNVRDDLNRAAGRDYAGCVWLTPNRPYVYPEVTARQWATNYATSLRENNPMLFLYGDKDSTGKRQAEFLFNEVLVANPKGGSLKPLPQTFIKAVKDTALKGGNLLGNDAKFGVESDIKKYLAAIQKERAKVARKPRMYSAPYFVDLASFGVQMR